MHIARMCFMLSYSN